MMNMDLGAVTAYALAVKNGFQGTEDAWLASLKGPRGEQGKPGIGGDWNAAEGEAGHVANRTHYAESCRVEVLAECQPTFDEEMGWFATATIPALEIGKTYTVVWNGVEYNCTAWNAQGVMGDTADVGLGNLDLVSGGDGTGEPFVLGTDPAQGVCIFMPINGSTELTISIYQESEIVHPLDPKYLPEGVPYCGSDGLAKLPVTGEWVDDSNDGVNDMFMINAPVGLEIGKTYTVDWNGTKYEAVGLDFNEVSGGETSGVFLGNTASMGGEDNGLPFALLEFSTETGAEDGCYGFIADLEFVEVPFAIYGGGAEIRKLDNRCLDLEYIKESLGLSVYELDLQDIGVEVITPSTTLTHHTNQSGAVMSNAFTSIIGSAKVLLTFKYNFGGSDTTYHGYVTNWEIDEKYFDADTDIIIHKNTGVYLLHINISCDMGCVRTWTTKLTTETT